MDRSASGNCVGGGAPTEHSIDVALAGREIGGQGADKGRIGDWRAMTTRESPRDRARRAAMATRMRLGGELRTARRSTGLSLEDVARACGVSRSQVDRIEQGAVEAPSLDSVTCIAGVVGLDLVVRTYPRGDPLRDAGHARLLDRLRRQLHPSLRFRTEVPLPIAGDLRAWDAVIGGDGWQLPVEAETVLTDGQAIERKLALKMRDGGFDHVVLLLADTRRNRTAAPGVQRTMPLDTRAVLAALRDGRDPGASGLVIL
jgi:transcriptional regulator with XRE-family HTH domain